MEAETTNYEEPRRDQLVQSVEEIMRIIQEAKTPGVGSKVDDLGVDGRLTSDDLEADLESEIDVSIDFTSPV